MSITVLSPGSLTTIQDAGRMGFMHMGVGECGVMDAQAYAAANRLVDNRQGEAVLETTLFGPTLRFDEDEVIALTGADMDARLDGQRVPRGRTIRVRAGQVLTMGFAVSGCRGYLAAAGGIDVPRVMGSRSTDLKCGMGGYEGRALRAGDVLRTGEHLTVPLRCEKMPEYRDSVTVRVVPGPQADLFDAAGIASFYESEYAVSPDSDRMGVRLAGERVTSLHGTDIVSDGIVAGAVQVPSGGQPIVLMADHQTTGGYAKIGAVISCDLPLLAQLKPGGRVRFRRVTVAQAQRASAPAWPLRLLTGIRTWLKRKERAC